MLSELGKHPSQFIFDCLACVLWNQRLQLDPCHSQNLAVLIRTATAFFGHNSSRWAWIHGSCCSAALSTLPYDRFLLFATWAAGQFRVHWLDNDLLLWRGDDIHRSWVLVLLITFNNLWSGDRLRVHSADHLLCGDLVKRGVALSITRNLLAQDIVLFEESHWNFSFSELISEK